MAAPIERPRAKRVWEPTGIHARCGPGCDWDGPRRPWTPLGRYLAGEDYRKHQIEQHGEAQL